MKSQITCSYLLTLALTLGLCGLGVPDVNAQRPAANTQKSLESQTAASAVANTAQSNRPRQAPMLVELAENVTSEKVKPGDSVHFRVVEDVIVDGLVLIAKGTTAGAKVERLDKRGGPEKASVLMARFGMVKTVIGEELPLASGTGNQSGGLEKLTLQFEDWPGVRGFLGRSIHYLPPGVRKVVEVTLPSQFDRMRLLAAQPTPGTPPGYATVYFVPPEQSSPDVWCGAVEIGDRFEKVLLRPGNYSCRIEEFSPQESYLDFDVADGGTYYLVSDDKPLSHESRTLSLGTAEGVADRWNRWTYPTFTSMKAVDLTKVDPEMFHKLRPFVCAEQLQCAGRMGGELFSMYAYALRTGPAQAQKSPREGHESAAPESPASLATKKAESKGPPTTLMVLELTEDLTSKKAKPGDEVHFHVVEDVIEDGLVVIAKGTAVKGRVERVDKRGGWMKDGGLIVRVAPVRIVTGEELPIASTLGQVGGKKDVKGGLGLSLDPEVGAPLTTPIILPFLPFMKGNDLVLPAGTRDKVEIALPLDLDRARLIAAQPSPEKLPGYATVYFLTGGAWCGAVRIGREFSTVLLRPGSYTCHVETFSQEESYLDFAVADGGTYYLVFDWPEFSNSVKADKIQPPGLSLSTAAEAIDPWNGWMKVHPSHKTEDLTKVDPEAFRKLPPFLRVEQ